MKKALLTLAAVATVSSTFAQGTINFANSGLTGPNGTYQAGIYRDNNEPVFGDPKGDSTIGAGAGFTVGLFTPGNLTTPIVTSLFRTTTAQHIFATSQPDVVIPGTTPNTPTTLVIRVWSTAAGSFDAAKTTIGAQYGEQTFTTGPLGGPNSNPTLPAFTSPDMGPNFTGFELETTVPEPSTIALGALGIGALLLRRRK